MKISLKVVFLGSLLFFIFSIFCKENVFAALSTCSYTCRDECDDGSGWVSAAGSCSSGVCCKKLPTCSCYAKSATRYAPTGDLCLTGNSSTPVKASDYRWGWNCYKSGVCTQKNCYSKRIVDGSCGSANLKTKGTKPTSNLCGSGENSTVTDTWDGVKHNWWRWICEGQNGGGDSDYCVTYKTCGKAALDSGYSAGLCVGRIEPYTTQCTEFYGGILAGTNDCDGPTACCMYNSNSLQCFSDSDCDNCEKCYSDSPGVSYCKSTEAEGEAGVCSGSNGGDEKCYWSQVSATCSSNQQPVIDDSVGLDGEFNWHCPGDPGNCGGDTGDTKYCSVDKSPKVNGSCNPEVSGQNLSSKPSISSLCEDGDPDWTSAGTDSIGTDGTFNWKCVGSCGGSTATTCSAVYDTAPEVDKVEMETESGSSSNCPSDDGVNHICEFYESNGGSGSINDWNKVVKIIVTGKDTQGVGDIDKMRLKFTPKAGSGGSVYTTDYVLAQNGVSVFAIGTSGLNSLAYGTYDISVDIDDKHPAINSEVVWLALSTGTWENSTTTCTKPGGIFKNWDCMVDVKGTVYDGSVEGNSTSCSVGVGYSTTVPEDFGFDLTYTSTSEDSKKMTVDSPHFSSDADNRLYWYTNDGYMSVFQNFAGTPPNQMRINGGEFCDNSDVVISGENLRNWVKPPADASSHPVLTIDYSSILDQDAWMRVIDGNIFSGRVIENYVPATCGENCVTALNGFLLQKNTGSGLSSYDKTERKYFGLSTSSSSGVYNSLLGKYKEVGTVVDGSKNWEDIGSTGVVFVSGNLTISKNISGDDFRMIVVGGNIDIGSSVTYVHAALFGNKITASGDSNEKLKIDGSLYGYDSVVLNRSLIKTPDSTENPNNKNPAVEVNYDPSLIFKLPKVVSKSITQWKLN